MDVKRQMGERSPHKHITSFQIIILGFFSVIMIGSLLLMLPISTLDGQGATFSDAIFTATSAVCVTGLVVHDTATYWTMFGQSILLLLIQIGGMGVVTVAVAIVTISGRKIGLMQRSVMQEAIAAPQVGGIVRMTKFILKTTVVIELTGAVLLMPVFCRDFGIGKGIWYSIFHSISAFCNAGFDLLGVRQSFSSLTTYASEPLINNAGFDLLGVRQSFSSLTTYASEPLINGTIMALIIVGGIGFLTWADVKQNKWHWHKYRMQSKVILSVTAGLILVPMQSKVILSVTAGLILVPAVYFFFFEFSELPLGERIWSSLFQSVTPRTAGGFNTADLTILSQTGQMIMIVLMLIGGSPGSTAGGMKTTTAAVMCSNALSVFQKKESAHFFGRRVADEAIRLASTVFMMYI